MYFVHFCSSLHWQNSTTIEINTRVQEEDLKEADTEIFSEKVCVVNYLNFFVVKHLANVEKNNPSFSI